jgi:beta-galactosidase/beta-glucuronidase
MVPGFDIMTDSRGYPRPQLVRPKWQSLNGQWDFAFDRERTWRAPGQVKWSRAITVPFSPETRASGIGDSGFYNAVWYRRSFPRPPLAPRERLVLHFGAVDYRATVWVNGMIAMRHEGGYTPFHGDVTDYLRDASDQEIVVLAEDDPADLAKPRGKQDWLLEPHSIWYPRTTGIWQTVWHETVPSTHVESLRWTSSLERWEIGVDARIVGEESDGARLRVKLQSTDRLLADDTYRVVAGEVHRGIALSDPGIDDYRNTLLWSPDCPTLIQVELELVGREGQLLESLRSYTAIRSTAVQGDRFLLNGRPYPLRLVLDQGYWPESGITAPDDEALRKDVLLAKAMGFNGVRKHQKIEDPRFLYWADTLGLAVWEEMPSAYRFTSRSVERVTREWMEAMARDSSHPCVIAWVPFNESWGVPDLPHIAEQRHYVQGLYFLTKTLDPSRPVVGNDGWESVATDIVGIHDYDHDTARICKRYGGAEAIPHLFQRERPGGRLLSLSGGDPAAHPILLSEFGGIALANPPDNTWGYSRCRTPAELAQRYTALLEAVRSLGMLAGFCYTQFTDTYQEANGLLYADRTPKFPIEEMARATRGSHGPR